MHSFLKTIFVTVGFVFATACHSAADYTVSSPNGLIEISIHAKDQLAYSVSYNNEEIMAPSQIALYLANGDTLGAHPKLKRKSYKKNTETITAPLHRQASFTTSYHQLTLSFEGGYVVEFRAYDEGCAYRFLTNRNGELVVVDELAQFNFNPSLTTWAAYTPNMTNAYQSPYEVTTIDALPQDQLLLTPLAVALPNGLKALVGESNLHSYPGMFLTRQGDHLAGRFPQVPKDFTIHPTRCQKLVTAYEDYIARTQGRRSFPWRTLTIGNDTQLPQSNLIYALGEPSRIEDASWIKGGKAAWEWWNDWDLTHVNFTPGINTATYKAYIDFAAQYGLEYLFIDEGWSNPRKGNVMSVIDAVNLKEIVSYANKKNVGLFLWVVANVLDDKLEEACQHYSQMGFKGFKVDFIDRCDQDAVDMVYRLSEMAAKYHLLMDFHGMYKPTGLNRTYPNVVNFEGVFGMEEYKWANPNIITYDVTFPFIRMSQGPVDYTSGGYRNAFREEFQISWHNPMTAGTRTHQAATYIVFDQPVAMLCETPSLYLADPACTEFIAALPVVVDETVIVDGKIGEYIVTARRKDTTWYVGGLTNWEPRSLHLHLPFLEEGATYRATLMRDVPNAPATAYNLTTETVTAASHLDFNMVSGGGFALILTKE